MIYGNKFLATTTESIVKIDPLMSFSILESSITELDNIFNFCFTENTIIYEASIKEIFSNILEKVKGAIVKILGWIRTAIEFITGKVLGFIDKMDKYLSKNESALLNEAKDGDKEYYYLYRINHEKLKIGNSYASVVIEHTVKFVGERLIGDFEKAESRYRDKNKYIPDGNYRFDEYDEDFEEIEKTISLFNEIEDKDILEKYKAINYSFGSELYKLFSNNFNKEVAFIRETDKTVKEFESKFKHIENVNKKINSIVTSDSSEYKRDLQSYINKLYGYSSKYMTLVPKAVTRYLGIINKGLKYNVKTLIRIAIHSNMPENELDEFKKTANEFVEGKEEPGTYPVIK